MMFASSEPAFFPSLESLANNSDKGNSPLAPQTYGHATSASLQLSQARQSSVPFTRTKRIQPIDAMQSRQPAHALDNDLECQSLKDSDDDDHTALTTQPSYDTSSSSFDPPYYDEQRNEQQAMMEGTTSSPNSLVQSPPPSTTTNASPRKPFHSLPAIDEVRSYASTLLYQKRTSTVQLPADEVPSNSTTQDSDEDVIIYREEQVDSRQPSKHRLRNQLCNFSVRVCAGLFLFLLGLFMVVFLMRKQNNNRGGASGLPQSTSRSEAIMNFLTETRVSKEDDLLRIGSPQNQALKWIATEDGEQRPVPDGLVGAAARQFAQRYALAVFYYATGGPATWVKQLDFLSDLHECNWSDGKAQVGFSDDTDGEYHAIGITCNADGFVATVFFPSNGLTGNLPAEFFVLREMTLMALPNNDLAQEFDVAIENLMRSMLHLEYVDWKYNRFSGTIPQILGMWENLQVLALSNNNFRGSLPSSLSNLSRLTTLALDDNELTGPLDAVTDHLIALEYFYADRNKFVHLVDDSFARELNQLRALDLSHNELYSNADLPLPDQIFNHPSLQVLDLAYNDLRGQLPDLRQQNPVLRFLSLRGNELHGAVSAVSLPRLERLTHLDIQENQFNGVLPVEMNILTELNYLAFGDNDFVYSDGLPDWLWSLADLMELLAPNLAISGEIPSNFELLTNLMVLDLSGNQFVGNVPVMLWDLPNLSYLLLHDNALDQNVFPLDTIMGPERLKVVTLYGNEALSGSLQVVCDQATELALLATDCSMDCPCCSHCCSTPGCFDEELEENFFYYEGMWESGYRRIDYAP